MIPLILGMLAVTYLPRLLPFVALDFDRRPPRAIRLLRSVPAAALGALLVPGIGTAIDGSVAASLAGAAAAVVAAALTRRVVVTLVAAVLASLAVLLIQAA